VRVRIVVAVLALSLPVIADAQCANALGISPPSPTNATPITVAYRGYNCSEITTELIEGNVITITTECGCVITCIPVARTLTIGPLPPGVYEIVVVDRHQPDLEQCATVMVASDPAAAPIPVLDGAGMALLIAGLALLAVRVRSS